MARSVDFPALWTFVIDVAVLVSTARVQRNYQCIRTAGTSGRPPGNKVFYKSNPFFSIHKILLFHASSHALHALIRILHCCVYTRMRFPRYRPHIARSPSLDLITIIQYTDNFHLNSFYQTKHMCRVNSGHNRSRYQHGMNQGRQMYGLRRERVSRPAARFVIVTLLSHFTYASRLR